MSKNVNLAKSDISSLFEQLESVSREAKQEEKKRRDYVEPSVSDISSLFENLEEASKEAKVEIEIKKSLSKEDQTKLSEFSGLMDSIETIVEEKIETVPCYERNTNLKVNVKSSHPSPATLFSMSWEGDYNQRYYKNV